MAASLKRKAETLPSDANSELKKPKSNAAITSFFGAPKTTISSSKSAGSLPSSDSTANAGSALKFDKLKWVSSLSEEQRKLLKLEIDTLDDSYLAHLRDEVLGNDFLDLKRFLQREIDSGKKIFPPLEEVYSWSRHTPLNTVKAVIIGQDPYHNYNQAHGLSFSVRPPTAAPPSLKNMYIALKNDYPTFTAPPKNGGLLTPWAQQGVLMLNTCLTVRAHEANSHSNKGWEKFTQKVIDTVAKVRTRGVVFLAWGSPAAKRVAKIPNKQKHLILQAVHPSPVSASRGFFHCGHFKKTNEWLEQRYTVEGTIDWNLNKDVPIEKRPTAKAIKATETKQIGGEKEEEPAMTKGSEAKKSNHAKAKEQDNFDEDDDAIEALEAIANSSVNGDDDDDDDAIEALHQEEANLGVAIEQDNSSQKESNMA